MEFEGIAVELDEELHFNRYRAKTLDSPAMKRSPDFRWNNTNNIAPSMKTIAKKQADSGENGQTKAVYPSSASALHLEISPGMVRLGGNKEHSTIL